MSQIAFAQETFDQPDAITKPRVPGRLEFLDCLRGLAALLVVYLHISRDSLIHFGLQRGWEYSSMHFLTFVEDLGKTGVVLFFAISGFIIPVSFKPSARPVVAFLVSRFFRLYPLYWLSLAAVVVTLYVFAGKAIPWPTVAANATMIQSALGKPDMLGVYWTLFIEWVFYAFCVAAFLLGRLGQTRFSFLASGIALTCAFIAAILRFHTHLKLPVALVLAISIMIWASLWRNYIIDGDQLARKLSYIYIVSFAVLMPVISLLAYDFNSGFDETWYRYTISYFVGIGMFLFFTTIVKMRSQVFVWLGAISYSLYLMHPLVATFVERAQGGILPLHSANLLFLEVLSISLVVATLCHFCIEKPSIELGHYVRARLQKA